MDEGGDDDGAGAERRERKRGESAVWIVEESGFEEEEVAEERVRKGIGIGSDSGWQSAIVAMT